MPIATAVHHSMHPPCNSHDDHGHDVPDHEIHEHATHAAYAHAPRDFGRAFAIRTVLNAGVVIMEAICCFQANSVALLADAGHNLGNVFGLLLAWGVSALAERPPTPRFTYGFANHPGSAW